MQPNWLPIRCDLHDDVAVISIASATGTDEFSVVGRLVRLWSWANEQLADGNATGVTVSWIDRYLSCPGFAMAMVTAGWLTEVDGGVAFPKFDVWNSQGAKRRLLTSKRVQEHRRKGNAKRNADSVTGETPTALPRGRERVIEKEESPTVSGAVAPPAAEKKPKAERKEPTRPHADARRAFCERWKSKYGAEYRFEFGKHGKQLSAMLKFLKDDVPKLMTIFDRFFADDDAFYAVDSRHDFARLSQHFNRWAVDAPLPTGPPAKHANGFKTKQEQAADQFAREYAAAADAERELFTQQGELP